MEVIAKTKDGLMIQATEQEVKAILSAVNGVVGKEDVAIGQRIPAIDYASTIRKIKQLGDSYDFKRVLEAHKEFNKTIEGLSDAVKGAANIEV